MTGRYFWVFIKGMMMGVADLVPGVSGGTIAFITEIYEELIDSISGLKPKKLKLLFSQGFASFWKAINGSFLLAVFGGILVSVFSFSYVIGWLYENQQVGLFAFFLGLLLSSFFFMRRAVPSWDLAHYTTLIIGAIVAFGATQLAPTTTTVSGTYLWLSGFIAISAMLLPGLSGSYILLVMGVYPLVLESLQVLVSMTTQFDQEQFMLHGGRLLILGTGIIMGLFIFSGLLKWLLKRFKTYTIAALLGLMLGACHKIWPWQNELLYSLGNITKKQTQAVWPSEFNGEPTLGVALLCFVLGISLLFLLEKMRQNQSTHEHP
ncbi:MAG: DUF368 domain-containing protein [Flavobacteriaceae bacterium]